MSRHRAYIATVQGRDTRDKDFWPRIVTKILCHDKVGPGIGCLGLDKGPCDTPNPGSLFFFFP